MAIEAKVNDDLNCRMTRNRDDIDAADPAKHIRAYYENEGIPPTATNISKRNPYSRTYYTQHDEEWDDVLRDAGVPGVDDLVADALQELFDNRPEWQEYITVNSKVISEMTGLSSTRIGRILPKIASGERTPEAVRGLSIKRREVSSKSYSWLVEASDDP